MNITESHKKIAKILRTKPEVLELLENKMEAITGKKGVIDKITAENGSKY